MRFFRSVAAAAALAPVSALWANSFTPDASDLWWNRNESGWGVNIIQQSDVLFATFFLYGADGRALRRVRQSRRHAHLGRTGA